MLKQLLNLSILLVYKASENEVLDLKIDYTLLFI